MEALTYEERVRNHKASIAKRKVLTVVTEKGRTYTHEATTWAKMYRIITDWHKNPKTLKMRKGWFRSEGEKISFDELFELAATE